MRAPGRRGFVAVSSPRKIIQCLPRGLCPECPLFVDNKHSVTEESHITTRLELEMNLREV